MKKLTKNISVAVIIVLSCSAIFFVTSKYYELCQPGIVVLIYHKVTEDGDNAGKYTLSAKKFKAQLDYLQKAGYATILPEEINSLRHRNLQKEIILSFDDGSSDHYDTVYPMLRKNKQRAIFFVISKYINVRGYLTENQIKKMSENNMEIGSHSYSHPLLDEMENSRMYYELEKSKMDLDKISEKEVVSFAPPGGWYNDDVILAARNIGYRHFFSCEIGVNNLESQLYNYKRIEVLGDMSLDEFKKLLNPRQILLYKITQCLKFFLHDLIGSNNYKRLQLMF